MITDRHKTWENIEPLTNQSRTSIKSQSLWCDSGNIPTCRIEDLCNCQKHHEHCFVTPAFLHTIEPNRRKTILETNPSSRTKPDSLLCWWTNTLSIHTGNAWSFFAKMHGDVRFAQHQLQLAPLQDWIGIGNDWWRTMGLFCCIQYCISIKRHYIYDIIIYYMHVFPPIFQWCRVGKSSSRCKYRTILRN